MNDCSRNGTHSTEEKQMSDNSTYRKEESWSCDSESDSESSSSPTSSSSSSVSSISSVDSDVSSSSECEEQNLVIKHKKKKTKGKSNSCIKTEGELGLEELPPIEDLQITVSKSEIQEIGSVSNILGQLIIVQSVRDALPLDLESVLFMEEGKPLGQIFEVFGPVVEPLYIIRFNSPEDIVEKGISKGMSVYCAPEHNDITSYVFTEKLRKIKGSDASWEHNNEPPEELREYSDDEQERSAKQKERAKNRKSGNRNQETRKRCRGLNFVQQPNYHSDQINGSDGKNLLNGAANILQHDRFSRPPGNIMNGASTRIGESNFSLESNHNYSQNNSLQGTSFSGESINQQQSILKPLGSLGESRAGFGEPHFSQQYNNYCSQNLINSSQGGSFNQQQTYSSQINSTGIRIGGTNITQMPNHYYNQNQMNSQQSVRFLTIPEASNQPMFFRPTGNMIPDVQTRVRAPNFRQHPNCYYSQNQFNSPQRFNFFTTRSFNQEQSFPLMPSPSVPHNGGNIMERTGTNFGDTNFRLPTQLYNQHQITRPQGPIFLTNERNLNQHHMHALMWPPRFPPPNL